MWIIIHSRIKCENSLYQNQCSLLALNNTQSVSTWSYVVSQIKLLSWIPEHQNTIRGKGYNTEKKKPIKTNQSYLSWPHFLVLTTSVEIGIREILEIGETGVGKASFTTKRRMCGLVKKPNGYINCPNAQDFIIYKSWLENRMNCLGHLGKSMLLEPEKGWVRYLFHISISDADT